VPGLRLAERRSHALLQAALLTFACQTNGFTNRDLRALTAKLRGLPPGRSPPAKPPTAPDGRQVDLPYDTLVVAAGATHSYFGKGYLTEYAPGMKTVEDARYLRDAILSKFEMAEIATDPQERAEWLTFVVSGAGPTGVELVGQIAELAHTVLPKDYRSVKTNEARIILLEGAGAVLPPFAKMLQDYTR
jgi:NADH dehydrogenase